ncbi:MAG TPA: universal stress protein [Cryobacterium sp.]|nr:universal stress protein [Cryobacterium sp.]
MSTWEKVVVGWDGSAAADRAVQWAVEQIQAVEPAQGSTKTVRIVSAVDDSSRYLDETEARWAVAVETFTLAERASRLRLAHPDLSVRTCVERGDPATVLEHYADQDTLLVVGSHNGQLDDGWSSSRLGAKLAAIARGAVAVIPDGDFRTRTRVVAGVDGSDESVSLGFVAAELALRRHGELLLVHASTEHPAIAMSGLGEAPDVALDRVRRQIERAYPALRVRGRVELTANPARALLGHAQDAALIVVGSRRPGVARRLLLGSVSRTLVSSARCPTIVVDLRSRIENEQGGG